MEENIKNRVILILSVLLAILIVSTAGSCNNAYQQRLARDKEMAARLELEEDMNKFTQQKLALEEKLSARDKELEKEKGTHQVTKEALAKAESDNQALQQELEKVTKLKETLEEDLKEALVTDKAGKPKK